MTWPLRLFLGSVLGCTLAFGALAQDSVTTNQTLDDCQLIPDDGARLACYDRVIKAGRQNIRSAPQAAQPQNSGSSPAQASAPMTAEERRAQAEQDYGLPKRKTEEGQRQKEQGEDPDEITVEVASTGVLSGGKVRIVTTNGMVWDQTEGAPPRPPQPGTSITIKSTFMGGHMCKLDKWTTVRCRRVE